MPMYCRTESIVDNMIDVSIEDDALEMGKSEGYED